MALPSWQQKSHESKNDANTTSEVSFSEAKKFFAVDASGSTIGSIMKSQRNTVFSLHTNHDDSVVLWNQTCTKPCSVDNVSFHGSGGTSPACILTQGLAIDQINKSDLWILLTDGEIADHNVSALTQLADGLDIIQVPVVLCITGRRYSRPDQANISVGISFFASARDALILFQDYTTSQVFVIDAKGRFELLKPDPSSSRSSWDSLPSYLNEIEFNARCEELAIRLPQHEGRTISTAVSLGTEWDAATDCSLVDVPALLDQQHLRHEDLLNLLAEEAFTQLALLCKTRGQLNILRNLLLRHRQQVVNVKLEDRHGAGKIMEKMQLAAITSKEKGDLAEQLRHAHALNRETYLAMKNSPSDVSLLASRINKLIDRALSIIADFERSTYTADILNRKSNRAMRSTVVSDTDSALSLATLDLSDEVDAFRGICPICCGEEQIMSVVLKKLDAVDENTTDFALNFPLAAAQAQQNADIISSQCICFQCSLLCQRSIYQEEIAATIPTLAYAGSSTKYINHQLALAFTAGLATGSSGMIQLFMTTLDQTLETKDWCSKDHVDDNEVWLRRQVLDWTLHNLLRSCTCRKNFAETGDWVDYPEALSWAVHEYDTAGLDSWIIRYPLAGFNQLLRWYELLDLSIDQDKLRAIQTAKLMHHTVTVIMSEVLNVKDDDTSWRHRFLQLIYQSFNGPDVPQDLGIASLVPAKGLWHRLEIALGHRRDTKRFLKSFEGEHHNLSCTNLALRTQLVTFWALYTQHGHTTAKTFFANVNAQQPLATAILDPEAIIPVAAIRETLISIFCPDAQQRTSQGTHSGEVTPRFVSPFGPSVLRCGFPTCPVVFYSNNDENNDDPGNVIRTRRAQHLKDIYGVDPKTFVTETGLPDDTKAPKAPTSYNNTLHISTARVWSTLSYECRQTIARRIHQDDDPTLASFIKDVRLEICVRSHRGDIYSAAIEKEVRQILPSLLEALRTASEKMDLEDKSGLSYVYDWSKNTIVSKLEYELPL